MSRCRHVSGVMWKYACDDPSILHAKAETGQQQIGAIHKCLSGKKNQLGLGIHHVLNSPYKTTSYTKKISTDMRTYSLR